MKVIKVYDRQQMDISNLVLSDAAPSMDAVSLALPQGVYTTFRTYRRDKVLHLDEHFDRLSESASMAGVNIDLDGRWLREMIRNIIPHSPSSDTRIRVQVDLSTEIGAIYLLGEALKTPTAEEYQKGIYLQTIKASRSNPAAKTTHNIKLSQIFGSTRGKMQVHEHILCDEVGNLLEGLSSNFFAAIESIIYTAGENILRGTTRKLVLECIGDLDYQLVLAPIHTKQLPFLDEAFITSVSRGILPVQKINDLELGRPGALTKSLMTHYQHKVFNELEDL